MITPVPLKQPPSETATSAPAPGVREPCRITYLRESDDRLWDAYLNQQAGGTLFHTTAWKRAVADTFNHEPIYLLAQRGSAIVGALPLFYVNSRLAGRLLISVPYGVGGGIVSSDQEACTALFHEATSIARERTCVSIDLRSESAQVPTLPVLDRYVGFCRELPSQSEDVLGLLPRKARAAARHAREKYKLRISYDDRHLREVWELYALSMRRLGSLTYPFSFFRRLMDNTPGKHWVSLIRWKDRPVAGLVSFLFKDTVLPYFFGSTDQAKACNAANYIYLCAMEHAVGAGYRRFDFGRSRIDNAGSFNFKKFQGFEPRPLEYQRWTAPGQTPPNLTPSNPKFNLVRKIWPKLPLIVTKTAGAWAAKHIPG